MVSFREPSYNAAEEFGRRWIILLCIYALLFKFSCTEALIYNECKFYSSISRGSGVSDYEFLHGSNIINTKKNATVNLNALTFLFLLVFFLYNFHATPVLLNLCL
ncbi:unnamed protein product [Clavelina lepadiformis]|uniref:Uncharacterized protein n=1 Tax=Clavelina lepadiformis TaxID=159417 RepID=A0ABP0GSI6_CLALP